MGVTSCRLRSLRLYFDLQRRRTFGRVFIAVGYYLHSRETTGRGVIVLGRRVPCKRLCAAITARRRWRFLWVDVFFFTFIENRASTRTVASNRYLITRARGKRGPQPAENAPARLFRRIHYFLLKFNLCVSGQRARTR